MKLGYNVFEVMKLNDKKELVHKPNQTIMITNGEISVVQRKAYNVILHQAQKQVKANPNQILFNFVIADLKEKAGIKATDNWHLKKDIEKLREISVETIHNNGDWTIFSLIAQAKKKKDFLEFQLPEEIKQALILNDYYTTLDLMIIKNLDGKYAVILYELAMRYHKKQIPELAVKEFRELTGTTNTSSYADFNNIRKKIIEPAINEINEKTDIKMSYETIKTGRKITAIKFLISAKKEIKAVENDEEIEIIEERKEDSRAVRELFELLPEKEQIENRKNELEKLLKEHSVEMLKADIEYTKNKAKTDFWAYFLKSIKSGHYSSAELEKKKIAEEKKKLRAELEEKEKKEQEKTNEEKEKIAIEKYKKMTTEEIEKYKKEFDKISENIKKIAFQNSLEVFVVSKLKME